MPPCCDTAELFRSLLSVSPVCTMTLFTAPAFFAGLVLSLSLIMSIGPQNTHVIRLGLLRQHLWLTIAICVSADIALIAIGVAGLARLGGLSGQLLDVMTGAGALVLLVYGAQALRRFVQPPAALSTSATAEVPAAPALSRRQAITLALALSWLNPLAWLDTAVLIGAASLAYVQPDNTLFGVGAAAGSVLWFSVLGLLMWTLGRRLNSPRFWRALDALVAVMMGGTALRLLAGLV
jgi:L-lysine exporter family protein LysE/ArgO